MWEAYWNDLLSFLQDDLLLERFLCFLVSMFPCSLYSDPLFIWNSFLAFFIWSSTIYQAIVIHFAYRFTRTLTLGITGTPLHGASWIFTAWGCKDFGGLEKADFRGHSPAHAPCYSRGSPHAGAFTWRGNLVIIFVNSSDLGWLSIGDTLLNVLLHFALHQVSKLLGLYPFLIQGSD